RSTPTGASRTWVDAITGCQSCLSIIVGHLLKQKAAAAQRLESKPASPKPQAPTEPAPPGRRVRPPSQRRAAARQRGGKPRSGAGGSLFQFGNLPSTPLT